MIFNSLHPIHHGRNTELPRRAFSRFDGSSWYLRLPTHSRFFPLFPALSRSFQPILDATVPMGYQISEAYFIVRNVALNSVH
jgi:hypothetical protein